MNRYPWLEEYLLSLPGTIQDFQPVWGWTRYKAGGKMFAATCCPDPKYKPYGGREMVILKCDPLYASLLRREYQDIVPGFYCTKHNWNSIYLDGAVPDDLLRRLCRHGWEEMLKTLPKKLRSQLLERADSQPPQTKKEEPWQY